MTTYQAVLTLSDDLGLDYSVRAREEMTVTRGNLTHRYSVLVTDLRDNTPHEFVSDCSMSEAVRQAQEAKTTT